MAQLNDVLAALLTQIGRGRSQADMATLEMAEAYRDHPLLSGFPVPRVTLDEVVIDLKMAIAAAPTHVQQASPAAKAEILERLRPVVQNVVATDPGLQALANRHPGLTKAWVKAWGHAVQRLDAVVPAAGSVDAHAVAMGATAVVRDAVSNTLLMPDTKVGVEAARTFHAREAPRFEERLRDHVRGIIEGVLARQAPAAPGRLEVLITAKDLEGLPPERISTVRLTLRESDRTWMHTEDGEGQPQARLVPA